MQLAESGSFLGQVDLFKVRGKFALTDAYESHFILPKGKALMITHRRVILLQVSHTITSYSSQYMHKVYNWSSVRPRYLSSQEILFDISNILFYFQQPSNIMGQRKFIPAKDACSIQWDVLWTDLVFMELTEAKKDQPNSPPSRLILYLKSKPNDSKEQVRVVKCSPNTKQALDVYSAIDTAINLYGQNDSKVKSSFFFLSQLINNNVTPCLKQIQNICFGYLI